MNFKNNLYKGCSTPIKILNHREENIAYQSYILNLYEQLLYQSGNLYKPDF